MRKINTRDIIEDAWSSRKGKFASASKEISLALGRNKVSTDLRERHPFDVEICVIPAGKKQCPYHSHSAQWEFYHVISGRGSVRHQDGITRIETDDAFIFEPGQPHQMINDSAEDLVLYIVADNPMGETCYYPDSQKWLITSPERMLLRGEAIDYLDGEE
ncbi:MAG: cupin domain-containing protein [Verrucomicrobia bacterium]|nr:cupin domain-containing protein [Verrucomicrobiota bacterium]MBV9671979.1 cupin domain-containing protein [Verrucomicrobiota bacterium]